MNKRLQVFEGFQNPYKNGFEKTGGVVFDPPPRIGLMFAHVKEKL